MRFFERAVLLLGSFFVIALGITHAFYGTDVHHWGFILGTYLDLSEGKEVFKEVYIQYGLGQPQLFHLLSHFIPINFSTIGIITSVTYALNLAVLFLVVKKIGNTALAILIYAIATLIHSYVNFPWPDYYSSLFLSISILMLLQERRDHYSLFAGASLFLAFYFRSTYIITFILATLAYLFIFYYEPRLRSKKIDYALLFFYSFGLIFVGILALKGTLHLWFEQSIGAGSEKYSIGLHEILRTLRKAFWPTHAYLPSQIGNTSFVIFFHVTAYFLVRSIFRREIPEKVETVFIAFLGLAGLTQLILNFDGFRLQTDCLPVIIIFAVVLKKYLQNLKWRVGLTVYFVILLLDFPNVTARLPLYEGTLESHKKMEIPIFKYHRFQPDVKSYYESLAHILCQDKRSILNLTNDSTVPYLCEKPKNSLFLPFYNPVFFKNETIDYNDKWIVVDEPTKLDPSSFTLVGTAYRPEAFHFVHGSEISVYLKK